MGQLCVVVDLAAIASVTRCVMSDLLDPLGGLSSGLFGRIRDWRVSADRVEKVD